MFEDLKTEKIGDGEFRVSFITREPTMVFLSKFFSIMSKEADVFFRHVVRRQRDADLRITRDAENVERAAAAKIERRKLRERFDAMGTGTTKNDRIIRLRAELLRDGVPVSRDTLEWSLKRAKEEAREVLSEKIRVLAAEGRPLRAIALELEIGVDAVVRIARDFNVDVEEDLLRIHLEDTLKRLTAEGLSLLQVGNRLNLPSGIVKRAAVSAGILKPTAPGKNAVYTPGDLEAPRREVLALAIAQLAAEGLSFTEIARKLRVCWQTVVRHAEVMGIKNPAIVRADQNAEKIAALARRGASSKEIGLAIGVAPATVAKHPAYKGNVVWYRKCRTVGYSGRASWAEQALDGQGRE